MRHDRTPLSDRRSNSALDPFQPYLVASQIVLPFCFVGVSPTKQIGGSPMSEALSRKSKRSPAVTGWATVPWVLARNL